MRANKKVVVEFADEQNNSYEFSLSDLDALFKPLEGALSEVTDLFFEIKLDSSELVFQVFCKDDSFCVFQDTYQHKILILGSQNSMDGKPEVIQVWDERWPLTYFLPLKSFVDWDVFKSAVGDTLALGRLDTYFEFSQTFPDLGLPDGYC